MSEHLQLSQETGGSRERFGTKKGIRCVPYPSVWHFPSLEVKGCPVDERLGWLSRAMLGECASAAEALSCVCSPGRKSKRACKEPWWGLQPAGVDAGGRESIRGVRSAQ